MGVSLIQGAEGPLDVARVQDARLEAELRKRVRGLRRAASVVLLVLILDRFLFCLRLRRADDDFFGLCGRRLDGLVLFVLLALLDRVLHGADRAVDLLEVRCVRLAVDRAEARVAAQRLEIDERAVAALFTLLVPVGDARLASLATLDACVVDLLLDLARVRGRTAEARGREDGRGAAGARAAALAKQDLRLERGLAAAAAGERHALHDVADPRVHVVVWIRSADVVLGLRTGTQIWE